MNDTRLVSKETKHLQHCAISTDPNVVEKHHSMRSSAQQKKIAVECEPAIETKVLSEDLQSLRRSIMYRGHLCRISMEMPKNSKEYMGKFSSHVA